MANSPRPPIGRSWARLAVLAVGLLAAGAREARAELVVLAGGQVLKVEEYRLEGRRARLTLPSGGTLKLPLSRIEHVVDDEIVPQPASPPPAPPRSIGLTFPDGAEPPQTPYGRLIFETARRHGMNPALVAAMVRAESAFDAGAVSPKGASGLLQLMPATADRFGVKYRDIFDPERNLDAGVRYLKWLAGRFAGDLPLVLAGYNAGEANVDRYAGVPPFRETRDYIRRIYAFLGLDAETTASGS